MSTDSHTPATYRWAHAVLPEDLYTATARALGYKTCKVTFRRPGSALGKSERQLPYDLVEKCRNYVWKDGDVSQNIVYFKAGRGPARHGLPPRYVKWLLSLGYPSGIVQTVVGVSRQTIHNYRKLGIKPKGEPLSRIPKDAFPRYVEAGREAFSALGGSGVKPDVFYALLALALEDVKSNRDSWDTTDVTKFFRN